jgi:hypothetical protein
VGRHSGSKSTSSRRGRRSTRVGRVPCRHHHRARRSTRSCPTQPRTRCWRWRWGERCSCMVCGRGSRSGTLVSARVERSACERRGARLRSSWCARARAVGRCLRRARVGCCAFAWRSGMVCSTSSSRMVSVASRCSPRGSGSMRIAIAGRRSRPRRSGWSRRSFGPTAVSRCFESSTCGGCSGVTRNWRSSSSSSASSRC